LSALKDQGVEVALFPCNQFGGQEPGTDTQVVEFCTLKGVKDANVFTKADVNGPSTRPTYKFLKEKGVLGDVAWNFAGKFIVDKEGNGKRKKSIYVIYIYINFHNLMLITHYALSIYLLTCSFTSEIREEFGG